ncbi:uncharacterized protein [Coffea arabica]|uniref:Endonuclease/exonuclease/phosphatase domain-containing protein n=1 Tax=Coffea arabica TaxID=13443 RepID=A0ABM4U0P5_COFAR
MCRENSVRLLVLLEPMSEAGQLEIVRRKLKFDKARSFVDRKIWMLWDSRLQLGSVERADQLVHVRACFEFGASFAVSFVYAKCTRVARRPLWEALEGIGESMNQPWMAIGDFNVISSANERAGGSPPNLRNMEEFNSSMFRCGLSEMGFDGSQFTWTNGSMWQRLDRALINDKWLAAYPVSKFPLGSERGLGDGCTRGGYIPFFNKLVQAREKLRGWSQEVFGNIPSRVKTAEAAYRLREEEYDRCRNDSTRACLNAARAEYNRELAVEYEFWRQKAAVKWLREGEANTSFLHSMVRQRKSSNFIARIKVEEGRWYDSVRHIKASATDFYAKLFTSESTYREGFPELPFTVPSVESGSNDKLKEVLTAEEI